MLLSIVTQHTTESVAAVVQRPGFSALKSESENVNFTLHDFENASAYGQFAAWRFVKISADFCTLDKIITTQEASSTNISGNSW